MSGHSKWAQIKRQKAATDKKKGALFSKLARSISLAAKDGGDPDTNYKLRLELDRAKDAGMPQDSVTRAIKRGTGEDTQGQIDEIVYEGYGPGGVAFLVHTATDNKNRTTSSIRHLFNKYGGNLGTNGSVSYLFNSRGQILLSKDENKNLENLSLAAIDLGAEDVKSSEEGLEIYTAPLDLESVKRGLEKDGARITSYELVMEPLTSIDLDPANVKTISALIEALEDDDDVIAVHTNANV